MYPYWSEHMVDIHHKELLRQAEQDRLATIYLRHHTHPLRHSLAMCGVVLVKVGMSLKQLETRSESQAV